MLANFSFTSSYIIRPFFFIFNLEMPLDAIILHLTAKKQNVTSAFSLNFILGLKASAVV